VIVIAHQLSTVLRADQVIVLEEGEVREVGTPEALIRKRGRFAEMYDLQQTSRQNLAAERASGI
jgi:ABC-type multidrug transport system fused ATPase/permease subunit